ncbi:unnamed protein product [Meloidogyne enterolobii]|uniref:Uncharacterized protein n=1 Tax=Meloidogyne enterolobii TaxID=390850 RepID=A0ACB0Z3E8_MELEN
MFLVFFLILILFAKQEATKLDNNTETTREEGGRGGEKEEATETTITMKNEEATKAEANRITEANRNKNETRKENETKEEIKASNKTEAKNKTKDEAEAKVIKSARQEESTTTLDDLNEEEYISASTITTSSSSNTSTDRCLHVDCPIVFPDCPSDSVPILSFTPTTDNSSLAEDNCCSLTRVECKCDSQKCLVPICPEGTELTFTHNGSDKPGHCCDQFECRLNEPNCQNVHCPDTSSIILDPYSPDGHTCPDDSYRPKPYIPTGGCCPIISQCQCKLSICEPALCLPEQQLLILERGRGEPGQCCDKFKCVNEGDEIEGLFLESSSNSGCRYGGHIYAKGEHWHAAPCQECECSSAGVALCKRMECPALSPDCQWVGLSQGECCPVCLGCTDDNGKNYLPGSNWERDGCTNCTCGGSEENFDDDDFHWQCQKYICQTDCEEPKPAGSNECCPICEDGPTIAFESSFSSSSSCPSLSNCELLCQYGLNQNNFTGCFECKCAGDGENNNVEIEEENKQQQQQYDSINITTSCEPVTKENCLYNDHAYSVGENFQVVFKMYFLFCLFIVFLVVFFVFIFIVFSCFKFVYFVFFFFLIQVYLFCVFLCFNSSLFILRFSMFYLFCVFLCFMCFNRILFLCFFVLIQVYFYITTLIIFLYFQDGPFRNCSCLLGGMLKCVEIHCPPCSSLSLPIISTTDKIQNNQQIETTGMNWCLQLCLQQQKLTENNKEQQQQQQLVAFERGNEQTLLFENLQQQNDSTTTTKGINNNNNKHLPHHQQQQTWPQPHWLFIVAALIVGIPAFALLLLFAIYLLLAVLFNSKYRKCGKQRNIEQSMLPITNDNNQNNNNNKWHIFQLIPKHFTKEKQQQKQNKNISKNVSSSNNTNNNDALVVKVSLLGINKNKEEEKNEEEK